MTTNNTDFLQNAINMYKAAADAFCRSENSEHFRDSHLATSKICTEEARTQALLSIAQDLHRIADRLDMLSDGGTDYNGNPMSVLRVGLLK